jgi:hypothetical protein
VKARHCEHNAKRCPEAIQQKRENRGACNVKCNSHILNMRQNPCRRKARMASRIFAAIRFSPGIAHDLAGRLSYRIRKKTPKFQEFFKKTAVFFYILCKWR